MPGQVCACDSWALRVGSLGAVHDAILAKAENGATAA
jgi:hypothetical protein